jgi:hypothetical protein
MRLVKSAYRCKGPTPRRKGSSLSGGGGRRPAIRLAFRSPSEKDAILARKTIFVSDLTGKTIDEKDAASVTIRYADARKVRLSLT